MFARNSFLANGGNLKGNFTALSLFTKAYATASASFSSFTVYIKGGYNFLLSFDFFIYIYNDFLTYIS